MNSKFTRNDKNHPASCQNGALWRDLSSELRHSNALFKRFNEWSKKIFVGLFNTLVSKSDTE